MRLSPIRNYLLFEPYITLLFLKRRPCKIVADGTRFYTDSISVLCIWLGRTVKLIDEVEMFDGYDGKLGYLWLDVSLRPQKSN